MPFRKKDPTSGDLARQAERMVRKGHSERAVADKFGEAFERAEKEAMEGKPSNALDYALRSAHHYERAARRHANDVIALNMALGYYTEAASYLGERAINLRAAVEMLEKALPIANGREEERDLPHRIGVLSNDEVVAIRQAEYAGKLGTTRLAMARRMQA